MECPLPVMSLGEMCDFSKIYVRNEQYGQEWVANRVLWQLWYCYLLCIIYARSTSSVKLAFTLDLCTKHDEAIS